MNRLDRALGILLLLQGRKALSAATLARRFEVSPRTVYRDVETLSALGVPIYAQRGRGGGFRLLEGYFLPPVTLTQNEALALVVGLALLGSLRSKPFVADLKMARDKLVAAMPETLQAVLANLDRHIGFETAHADIFHPEHSRPVNEERTAVLATTGEAGVSEDNVVGDFVQGIISRSTLLLRYHSPYRAEAETHAVEPLGAFADRGYWYLVATVANGGSTPRVFRADRVLSIARGATVPAVSHVVPNRFDIRDYLDRHWLASAMRRWADEAPVRVRLAERQAERLRQDWYFRWARYEPQANGDVEVTFGETDQETVLELIRWLGPGAELLEPESWRSALATQLGEMRGRYS